MERWVEIRKAGNFMELAEKVGISPVTARVLRNRELLNDKDMKAYLYPDETAFHDSGLLSGIEKAVFVVANKINLGKKIRIIGDYDVDGVCATYILFKGLSFMGADCDYRIPHRISDGYGINKDMITKAAADGIDTIITCDNGISAYDQTEYANELGITMVITDHHEVPYEVIDDIREYKIPNASAVVDPKLPEETYPFSGICGAFVAYKFICEFAKRQNAVGRLFDELSQELMEFAALATVCDVMELKDENRALVKRGIELMTHSKNVGLRALLQVTGLNNRALSTYSLGFVIGPCINASGRLDTSLKALNLLLEESPDEALKKATELKMLNDERKEMTLTAVDKACKVLDAKDKLSDVIVVCLTDCHESLAGIVAGRIREKYGRPTFIVTPTENGLKGSGRSIEAYDMYAGLVEVGGLLDKYGGHKMAAGISLKAENLNEFEEKLNTNSKLCEDDFCETVRLDMELPFVYISMSLARELELLAPFGTGNEKPLFARTNVTFISGHTMGHNGNAARYKVCDDGEHVYELTYFGDIQGLERFVEEIYGTRKAMALHSGARVDIKLDIAYEISINSYNGRESVQMLMKHYR